MDEKFKALHGYVEATQKNIRGIVAMKDGAVVYSDCFGGYADTDTVHVMSATKSVASLLVGIAIDRRLIADVKQPVLDFFPDYKIKRGERTIQTVTIEHLLTMTAPYKYRSEPWTKIYTSENWTAATLDILGGKSPAGETFRYSTLGIHILTAIIAKQSGMSTADFANRYLFEPVGVAPHTSYLAETAEEHKRFIMSTEPKGSIWFSDPQGVGTAGYGLCLSACDMAKIGRLCLEGGMCGGVRVVSQKWLEESIRPRRWCDETFAGMGYGYLWWTPECNSDAYAALGNSGNVIYIHPSKNTVVAVTAVFNPRVLDRVQFIKEHIEPLL